MSALDLELDRYLDVRRGLGFELKTSERVLRRFVAFATSSDATHVSTDLFLRWQQSFGKASKAVWATRLGIVRHFAAWLHVLDPLHQIPPKGLIPGGPRRSRPYIYSEDEIRAIVTTAEQLASIYGLRGHTYATLFGLISVTGMRISEALALDSDDVDYRESVLTIKRDKQRNTRYIPLDASVIQRLDRYEQERNRLLGFSPKAFFVSEQGKRISDCNARYNFAVVSRSIGLRSPQRYCRHGRGPRIHDLRHSFAARTMVGWYRRGQDPTREMIKLTTYLGHCGMESTYWYLEGVPELLELASARAEAVSTLGEHHDHA